MFPGGASKANHGVAGRACMGDARAATRRPLLPSFAVQAARPMLSTITRIRTAACGVSAGVQAQTDPPVAGRSRWLLVVACLCSLVRCRMQQPRSSHAACPALPASWCHHCRGTTRRARTCYS